ncbi:MAG TPA: hypothetical protein VFS27_11595, partial [Blastocatellia bacterium]|nr:hypothetical protein [Blastocatellia bacterium]
WDFTNIHASPIKDADDLSRYFAADYVGSTHFLSDDGFVFDPEDLSLVGLCLLTPENTVEATGDLDFWLNGDEVAGVPRLTSPRCKFGAVSPCVISHLSERGDYLLCAPDTAPKGHAGLRVAINERMSLLFQNHIYCGFLVSQPMRSLVRFDGTFEEGEGDVDRDLAFLLEPLRAYLNLIREENWPLIARGDMAIKNGLTDILRQLASYSANIEPVYALRDRCQFLLKGYFSA